MISVVQAQQALEELYEDSRNYGMLDSWYVLEEFIKQYHDLQKVKALPFVLRPKKEE